MGKKKRKANFKAKIGLPERLNPNKDISFISGTMNGPFAISYLIYAHNQGVTLRDLAAALLLFIEKTLQDWIDDKEWPDNREEYIKIHAGIVAFKTETDGGLSLDEKHIGLIEFMNEWGDFDTILKKHIIIATGLVEHHRAGQSILNVIEKICFSDEEPNDLAVLYEAAQWENRPGGKMEALIHFSR